MYRILWVDDEPIRSTLLQPLLDAEEVELVFAHGLKQVEYYTKQAWDLILLDHDMAPMEDGRQVVRWLIQNHLHYNRFLVVSQNSPAATEMVAWLKAEQDRDFDFEDTYRYPAHAGLDQVVDGLLERKPEYKIKLSP